MAKENENSRSKLFYSFSSKRHVFTFFFILPFNQNQVKRRRDQEVLPCMVVPDPKRRHTEKGVAVFRHVESLPEAAADFAIQLAKQRQSTPQKRIAPKNQDWASSSAEKRKQEILNLSKTQKFKEVQRRRQDNIDVIDLVASTTTPSAIQCNGISMIEVPTTGADEFEYDVYEMEIEKEDETSGISRLDELLSSMNHGFVELEGESATYNDLWLNAGAYDDEESDHDNKSVDYPSSDYDDLDGDSDFYD